MNAHADLDYKSLFAHPELVCELLQQFSGHPCFDGLPATAFERVNPVYTSERPSERRDDLVWRVQVQGDWLYIYILLEFQQQSDHWMALRMLVYSGLLCQDLVKRKELSPAGLLPSLLPLVFYHGNAPWRASIELAHTFAAPPECLAEFQPEFRYCLVDQHRLDPAQLARNTSVLALLFRTELSDGPDVLYDVLPLLITWLEQDAQSPLRRSVKGYLQRLLRRQFSVNAEGTATILEEGVAMAEEHVATWSEVLQERGRQKGIEQGIEQGIKQGIQLGTASGQREGRYELVRKLVKGMLSKRYGGLTGELEDRIDTAPPDLLECVISCEFDPSCLEKNFPRS